MLDENLVNDLISSLEHYKTTLDEINFASDYLAHYGYLTKGEKITKEDFEKAVKQFQSIFDIDVDGQIGPQTVTAMKVPRCALKDIEMEREFSAWRKDHLKYFVSNYVKQLPHDEQEQIIAKAWQQWMDVCDIHIEKVNSAQNADIVIGIGQGGKDQFDGPSGTLAWAELPNGGNQLIMKFDLDETWIDNPRNRGILMLNVACHEFGHLLGLEHSKQSSALMAPYYNVNVAKPQQNDDIPRIQAYYGKPQSAPTPTPTPIPTPVPTPTPVPPVGSDRMSFDIVGDFKVINLNIPGYRVSKLD